MTCVAFPSWDEWVHRQLHELRSSFKRGVMDDASIAPLYRTLVCIAIDATPIDTGPFDAWTRSHLDAHRERMLDIPIVYPRIARAAFVDDHGALEARYALHTTIPLRHVVTPNSVWDVGNTGMQHERADGRMLYESGLQGRLVAVADGAEGVAEGVPDVISFSPVHLEDGRLFRHLAKRGAVLHERALVAEVDAISVAWTKLEWESFYLRNPHRADVSMSSSRLVNVLEDGAWRHVLSYMRGVHERALCNRFHAEVGHPDSALFAQLSHLQSMRRKHDPDAPDLHPFPRVCG